MNLNNYNKNGLDTRGEEIEKDLESILDTIAYIKETVPYYYNMISNGEIPIYQQMFRGVGNYKKDSLVHKELRMYKPSKFKRHSANTENYYTEIIDNSKYWEGYPNRSKSIIATTSRERAQEYGVVYHVIPLNENSRIVVSPAMDIWNSFNYALGILDNIFEEDIAIQTAIPDFQNMGGFNNFLMNKFELSKEADYNELKSKVNITDKIFKLLDRPSTWNNSRFVYDKSEVLKIQNKWGSFLNYIEYLLSPKWNGFKLMEYNKNIVLPTNRELWLDSDSLLISHRLHNEILNILK